MAARERNVLGGELEACGTDPVTGFYRDGYCTTGPEDRGSHTVCVVVTAEFLEHQRSVGNDLVTPRPEWRFPGLTPGDGWCAEYVTVPTSVGVAPLPDAVDSDRGGPHARAARPARSEPVRRPDVGD